MCMEPTSLRAHARICLPYNISNDIHYNGYAMHVGRSSAHLVLLAKVSPVPGCYTTTCALTLLASFVLAYIVTLHVFGWHLLTYASDK